MKNKNIQRRFGTVTLIFISLTLLWAFLLVYNAFGICLKKDGSVIYTDSLSLKKEIVSLQQKLNYPNLVDRFYQDRLYKRAWVMQDTVHSDVWASMLLMDCVLQFGLNRNDFHPDQLTYDALRPLTSPNAKLQEQEIFDIYLTDALITLINHLHYGKFNPVFTTERLESKILLDFDPVSHLKKAMGHPDFMANVTSAQPQADMYKMLQDYLHLVKGQYIDDCYEFPEGDARKMAINMERLRWINTGDRYFIQINIPSYTLKLVNNDHVVIFKTIVGKPSSPTPELESKVKYITTSPDWKVPHKIFTTELLPKIWKDSTYLINNHYSIYDRKQNIVPLTKGTIAAIKANPNLYDARQSSGCDNALGKVVFRFPNVFDIYLHDTPEQKLFKKQERAFSHGCIRVENAGLLAELLLRNDGTADKVPALKSSMLNMRKKDFHLKNTVPVKITYITCEVNDGQLRVYPDVYHRDQVLESLMFPVNNKPVKK
ncbi:L,D-transpeptidase catalytic domain [Pedobacter suwonensis]|uniref:L,D-transpeptidase catalytic domain n=1 Tax=Pedobacter suwonensis TaxID=332999 RepID=A0A1I0SHC2_9SPHI|nr:L,D-transpeptidase family protein [Pedobacter suwonensis]SFA38833.1 L,D-transpeptidase catalytic domain [Pedobacter suwonensis]